MVNPHRLVRVMEACKYGRWSVSTLYRLIHAGSVVAVKDGGLTWIDLDSIDAYRRSLPRLAAGCR